MLDDEEDSRLLHNAAELLARAQVPDNVLAVVRVGRVVALQKPNGRVRLRRLVGRVLAQQFGLNSKRRACPSNSALARLLELKPSSASSAQQLRPVRGQQSFRLTLLGHSTTSPVEPCCGACRPALRPLLPYSRQFYAESSSYTWYVDAGHGHRIQQGEGGEQGDPRMPALYALAQHPALAELQG